MYLLIIHRYLIEMPLTLTTYLVWMDYGRLTTGFASIPHLRQMPVDKIKIDSWHRRLIRAGEGRWLSPARSSAWRTG